MREEVKEERERKMIKSVYRLEVYTMCNWVCE